MLISFNRLPWATSHLNPRTHEAPDWHLTSTNEPVVLDAALVADTVHRSHLRALLLRHRPRPAVLLLRATRSHWPSLQTRSFAAEDPMVTAHLQSFVHLFDLVIAELDDYHILGGTYDTFRSLALISQKTRATLLLCNSTGAVTHLYERTRAAFIDPPGDAIARLHALVPQYPVGAHGGSVESPELLGPAAIPDVVTDRAYRYHTELTPKPVVHIDSSAVLVSTDLHGNFADFLRIKSYFNHLQQLHGSQHVAWVLTGDLVHGPDAEAQRRASAFAFDDASPRIIEELASLKADFPQQVHLLVGVAELAHLRGPSTRRFWPDEVEALQQRLTAAQHQAWRALLGSSAYAACAGPAFISHALPTTLLDPPNADLADACIRSRKPLHTDAAEPLLRKLDELCGVAPNTLRYFVTGHDENPLGLTRTSDHIQCSIFGAKPEHKCHLVLWPHQWPTAVDVPPDAVVWLYPPGEVGDEHDV